MTRTQFAVALAVLFVGGVVGGMLSDHLRGGTVAWAQEGGKPLQLDALTVKKLLVLESVAVTDGEQAVAVAPNGVSIGKGMPPDPLLHLSAHGLRVSSGQSEAFLSVDRDQTSLSLDCAGHHGNPNADTQFSLFCRPNGFSRLALSSPETKESVGLYFLPPFGPSAKLYDRAGSSRVTLGPDDNGTWKVGVWNADGLGRTLEAGH